MNPRLTRKISTFSSRLLSGSNSKNDSVSDQAQVAPARLANIPAVMERLHLKWDEYQDTSRPAEAIVSISIEYINHVKDQMKSADGVIAGYWQKLGELINSLEHRVTNEESHRTDTSADIDLISKRDQYFSHWQKDKAEFALKEADHKNQISIIASQIQDINEEITDVRAKQVLEELRVLRVYQKIHQQIDEQLDRLETLTNAQGCFAKLFSCTSNTMNKLTIEIEQLQAKRDRYNTKNIDSLRDSLVEELQAQINAKRKIQEELINHPPVMNVSNADNYVKTVARIKAQKYIAECHISQHLMLDFMRLYIYIKAIYDALPTRDVVPPSDESAPLLGPARYSQVLADLKPLFQQFAADIKNNLQDFYCMAPGRYEYQYYVDVFKGLKEDDRRKLLAGTASIDVIKKLFPYYEDELHEASTLKM